MEIRKLKKSEFPFALLEIPEPPKDLWILGDLLKENLVYLCVVGSRKNTTYGREACQKILSGLRGYPIAIVSGFALGIDTLAHQTALKIGLPTIVFPGSGLAERSIYPKINTRMIKEIIEGGGCLLSEFEPDFSATLWGFPKRNRLMAGISKATLVIEATEKSGTLITARLALDYNRDLLAVPGSIFSPSSLGTNKLIREGATSILSSEDLIEALGFERPVDLKAKQNLQQNLSTEEKEIIKILKEPLPRDVLFQKLKMSSAEINSLLTLLEIKGIIKEEVGEIYLS